jgi:P27 family predicted phage terminase small subunit
LNAEAIAEWRRVTPLLANVGTLDRTALALYCAAWARWTKAEAEIATTGEVVKSPSGFPIQNPWRTVANQAYKQLHAMLREFGLSPTARARLKKLT